MEICRRKNGKSWNCKNVSGDNILQYCEKHYNQYLDLSKKMEEEEEEEDEKLPPDEQRCSQTGTGGWRCKNSRMSRETKRCEKHYYFKKRKLLEKTRGDAKGAGSGPKEEEIRGSKRRRNEVDDGTETQKLGATVDDSSAHTILEDGIANIGRKSKNVERTQGYREPESSTRTGEPLVEFGSMENYYRSKCLELSVELEKKNVELEKMKVELEKKKVECTELRGELEGVVQTRKTAATQETEGTPTDATQYWKKMFFDLESRFLRNREECVECPISKLGSLILRSGNENSILGFVDLPDSEMVEPEMRGLQNDVTQSVEKQIDETSCGGDEYSHVYELKTKEEVLDMYENVKEEKGLGFSEEKPSQDHLEMSNKPFANLVSDGNSGQSLAESEDADSYSETSLGGLLDRLEMKYRNMKENQELKWKFEADMLSSFEKDPELNMKAVCALYRHHIAEAEISTNGLFSNYSDVLRATTLAKFLMNGACHGDLRKSAKELEKFDSKGVEDCKRLARSYFKQLFSIYQSRKDPFFLPTTTARHEDQTAK